MKGIIQRTTIGVIIQGHTRSLDSSSYENKLQVDCN